MNDDFSFRKALKKLPDKPDTLWQKIVDMCWKLRWKFDDTTIGTIWKYRIDQPYLYPMRCYFNPRHRKLRNSIPKTWCDSTELVREVNFAIITEFYEDEYLNGFVNWESDEPHKEFAQWLEKSYDYIKNGRPKMQETLDASYPKHKKELENCKDFNEYFNQDNETPYEERYKNVIYWENLIQERDDKMLVELITKYRSFLWT